MTTTTENDIVEEYEKIRKAEDANSLKIRSADRVEDLLCFPIGSQEKLRKTDQIYMTDDKRRLLLIREYTNMRSSKSVNSSPITVSSSQKITNSTIKSKETIPINKSISRTKRSNDSDQENGCVVDFKVFVDDKANENHTHQIHIQANYPDFAPNHLYINGMKFSQKL